MLHVKTYHEFIQLPTYKFQFIVGHKNAQNAKTGDGIFQEKLLNILSIDYCQWFDLNPLSNVVDCYQHEFLLPYGHKEMS